MSGDRGAAGAEPGSVVQPGSVVEEAARLAEAAADWTRRVLPQVGMLLRGERPDVTDKLAEAGTAVVAAVRAVLDALGTPSPPSPDGRPGEGGRTAGAPVSTGQSGVRAGSGHAADQGAGRVQRIDVD